MKKKKYSLRTKSFALGGSRAITIPAYFFNTGILKEDEEIRIWIETNEEE